MAIPRSLILVLLLASFLVQASAKKTYIVYMGAHFHGPNPTEEHFEQAAESHRHFLASFVGSHDKAKEAIIYSYNKYINGFSAVLEDHHAAQIAKHSSVVSVFLDKARKLHTTRSWGFMNKLAADNGAVSHDSLLTKARFGQDSIIANIDTGVWPESESFNDVGYGPIPARWKGSCDGGHGFNCNNKLIGAYYYSKGYLGDKGAKIIPSELSTRDFEGHGSHTLSTLGGNMVANVSVNGAGMGTARGGSPRARVAAYKVCWRALADGGECFDSDIIAAFDQAIHDGVDVISLSVGGPATDYFSDGIAVGSFHAVNKGVVVVCSAGNDGPTNGTVTNVAPWIFTIGASTLDRKFESSVVLGNGLNFTGASISEAFKKYSMYPLTTGAQAKLDNVSATDATVCNAGTLDPRKVEGKILVCQRGGTSGRLEKSLLAKQAGAVGMILCNGKDDTAPVADDHFIPTSHIDYQDGLQVFNYINSTGQPTGYITPATGALNNKAPYMIDFSSRGPNTVTPEILKPDVTAPGVEIIAAYSLANSATMEPFDNRTVPYITMSGTSMSCPHVAGLVGLLKTLYSHWSPAAIRSAIMTTALNKDDTGGPILDAVNDSVTTPFSRGAGHINPNGAMDPGLVYDIDPNEYLHFLCALGYNSTEINAFADQGHQIKCHEPKESIVLHFNYPSISVPQIQPGEVITLRRKVTNVGPAGTYRISVTQPKGALVYVHPPTLSFEAEGEAKSFKVRITGVSPSDDYSFGAMTWSDGLHNVRSNIAVNVHGKH